MKNETKAQAIIALWGLAGASVVWYIHTVRAERKKRKGIELWLKSEIDAIEIERKEKGL